MLVKTQLLYPTLADQIKQAALDEASEETVVEKPTIKATDYGADEKAHHPAAPSSTVVGSTASGQRRRDMAVVRVEVIDTGVGIRPRDLEQNQLFTAYGAYGRDTSDQLTRAAQVRLLCTPHGPALRA